METTSQDRLKIVTYARVSTDGQAEDGLGLEVQGQAMDKWIKSGGHRLVRACRDEGVSGTVDAFDREGLACAISAIEDGVADALLIPRLDRLARKLTIQEAVLAQVWERGGRIFTVDSGEILRDDPSDPMRTALRQIVGVFAELDRSQIVKRLQDGRRAKAAGGGYAGGRPRYGWRAVDGDLVEDPAEQAVIARMASMRANGDSLRAIASALEAEGIRSKGGKPTWTPSTVSRVLDDGARDRAKIGSRKRRERVGG